MLGADVRYQTSPRHGDKAGEERGRKRESEGERGRGRTRGRNKKDSDKEQLLIEGKGRAGYVR